MATKYVEVATTNSRQFVKEILSLGAQGAILPDNQGVFKGVMLSCKLEVDEDVLVNTSPIVRVIPNLRAREQTKVKPSAIVPDVVEEEKVVKRGRKKKEE